MNGSVTNRVGTLQFVIKKIFTHTIVSMTSKVRVFEEISKPLPTRISILQVLPIWGIEPQIGNADAGTRRPQVRTRPSN